MIQTPSSGPVLAVSRPPPCAATRPGDAAERASAPPAAIASPAPLSVVVALRWGRARCPRHFSLRRSHGPGPPSLGGVPSGQFPCVGGTMGRSDSPPPVPPRFVAFARPVPGRYPGRIRVSLPRPPDAPAAGLELVTRYLRPGSTEETAGPPRFLGNPDVSVPCSPTPGIRLANAILPMCLLCHRRSGHAGHPAGLERE